MSRIGRILPLGAALMVASCADGTGPPDQLDQQPLGAISGPGVSSTGCRLFFLTGCPYSKRCLNHLQSRRHSKPTS